MGCEFFRPLPIVVNSKHDESGLSFVYRALLANGLSLKEALQWLKLKSWTPIRRNDVNTLAWITGADPMWLAHQMFVSLGSQRTNGYGFMRHKFGEGAVDLIHRAKLCPICVKEQKYTKAAWQLRCVCGCIEHDSVLLDRCPYCCYLIGWQRPAIDICNCGHFLTSTSVLLKLPTNVLDWLRWVDARLADAETIVPATDFELPPILNVLTIDGAFRLVLATGFLTSHTESMASASGRIQTSLGISEVVSRGLTRLSILEEHFNNIHRLESIIYEPALEKMKANAVATEDSNCAAFLLDLLRGYLPKGASKRGRYRRGQLSLFL